MTELPEDTEVLLAISELEDKGFSVRLNQGKEIVYETEL